jgi:hypothetical protein
VGKKFEFSLINAIVHNKKKKHNNKNNGVIKAGIKYLTAELHSFVSNKFRIYYPVSEVLSS